MSRHDLNRLRLGFSGSYTTFRARSMYFIGWAHCSIDLLSYWPVLGALSLLGAYPFICPVSDSCISSKIWLPR